jgi:hypothetical protein
VVNANDQRPRKKTGHQKGQKNKTKLVKKAFNNWNWLIHLNLFTDG